MMMDFFSGLTDEIGNLVGKLTLSSQEKKELEARMTQIVYRYAGELTQQQGMIVRQETGGNWLQRSWRPLIMLALAAVVLAGTFIDVPYLGNDSRFWDLLEIGLGGYVVGRSLESMQGLFTKSKRHGKR